MATATTITISTRTPVTFPSSTQGSKGRSDRLATRRANPLVGVAARVAAGVIGVVLGVAIGLVSAGFDTTRLLLAVGAVALGLGWVIALATYSPLTARHRR